MNNALAVAVQSMQNDLAAMDAISQNVANVATPGYKRVMPSAEVFGNALRAAARTTINSHTTIPPSEIHQQLDISAGSLKQTNRPWDLAIIGDGYFEFSTPGGPAYGRAGDFHVDGAGRLVSQAGFPVQGSRGEILLKGSEATIDHAGRIVQDGIAVGQIKVVQFSDRKSMAKTSTGLLRPTGTKNDPGEVRTELQVGYLENSNVDPMHEMVSMMLTARHFEATQKLFQGYDEALGTAIRKLGEF